MAVHVLQRDIVSAPFFDATATGRLLLRRCRPAHHWNNPAALTCVQCGTGELAWADAAGTGTVVSWAIVHANAGEPLPILIVQLDEGPWLRGPLRQEPGNVHAGLRVCVGFERADGGEAIPVFLPVDGKVPA